MPHPELLGEPPREEGHVTTPLTQRGKRDPRHGEAVEEVIAETPRLHLVVEIKGFRREDAKEKASTMYTYWVPGVNHLGTYGRWAFAEFTEVYQIESDFAARVKSEFNKMIQSATTKPTAQEK